MQQRVWCKICSRDGHWRIRWGERAGQGSEAIYGVSGVSGSIPVPMTCMAQDACAPPAAHARILHLERTNDAAERHSHRSSTCTRMHRAAVLPGNAGAASQPESAAAECAAGCRPGRARAAAFLRTKCGSKRTPIGGAWPLLRSARPAGGCQPSPHIPRASRCQDQIPRPHPRHQETSPRRSPPARQRLVCPAAAWLYTSSCMHEDHHDYARCRHPCNPDRGGGGKTCSQRACLSRGILGRAAARKAVRSRQ